jgi:hypothetical protein
MRWARTILGAGVWCAALACSGFFSEEEPPTPILVENEDGSVQTITQGSAAEIPPDFPLPLPPGLQPESSIVSSDGGPTILSFRLENAEQAVEMVEFYGEWFEAEGLTAEVRSTNLAGMKSTALSAKREGHTLAVAVMDGMDTRMLTLTSTPPSE